MTATMGTPATRRAVWTFLVVALTANAGPLEGQLFRWTTPNYRPVSGETGDNATTYQTIGSFGLQSISWGEYRDVPVAMRVGSQRICRGSCPARRTEDVGGGWGNVSFDKTVSVGANRYITAIRVCLSGQNDPTKRKIKGIRLWGATIAADGTVQRENTRHQARRTNCRNNWNLSEKRSCLGDRVVVGLRIHRRFNSGFTPPLTLPGLQWGFTGIDLECARVVP